MVAIVVIIVIVVGAATAGLTRLYRDPKKVTLMPYQCGVIYRRGLPTRDVGPGTYTVRTGFEKLIFLDSRPVVVSFENRAVSLQDGWTAIYGFSAIATMQDPRKALYSSVNCSQVPAYVLLCTLRAALNRCASAQLRVNRDSVIETAANQAKQRLAIAGFELKELRLTHLSVTAPTEQQTYE